MPMVRLLFLRLLSIVRYPNWKNKDVPAATMHNLRIATKQPTPYLQVHQSSLRDWEASESAIRVCIFAVTLSIST